MKLTLEQNKSQDSELTIYYIRVDSRLIYSTYNLEDAEKRFSHIKEVGIGNYLKEIEIIKTILKEEEL